jgi:AraC-like DNA-binding protein
MTWVEVYLRVCQGIPVSRLYVSRFNDLKKFDETQMSRVRELGGMEVMKAVFTGHAFPRHFHDTYVIEVVEEGADEFLCAGKKCLATKGEIVVINPGEVHTGKPADDRPLQYRSFYPSAEAMTEISEEVGDGALPWFSSTVIRDSLVSQDLVSAHEALLGTECGFEGQSRYVEALGRLVARYASKPPPKVRRDDKVVETAKAILWERYATPPALKELAFECGYSSYHLLRLFRDGVGVPPYEFLNIVRVERSKSLLRRGVRPAEVALQVGYADQAHLTRQFKRLVGVTPGQYRN